MKSFELEKLTLMVFMKNIWLCVQCTAKGVSYQVSHRKYRYAMQSGQIAVHIQRWITVLFSVTQEPYYLYIGDKIQRLKNCYMKFEQ